MPRKTAEEKAAWAAYQRKWAKANRARIRESYQRRTQGLESGGFVSYERECSRCSTVITITVARLARRDYHCYSCRQKPHKAVASSRYRRKYPEKIAAHNTLSNAVKSGRVERQPCRDCLSLKTQAHHEDYSLPLDVVWLCARCHAREHTKKRRVA